MTQSFDELFAPKAMSLDELFAAIRPPPLLPVSYPLSDNSDFMSPSSAAGANMPQPIPSDRLWAGVQPAPLQKLNYPDAPGNGNDEALSIQSDDLLNHILARQGAGLRPLPDYTTAAQTLPIDRLLAGVQPAPLAPLNYSNADSTADYAATTERAPNPLGQYASNDRSIPEQFRMVTSPSGRDFIQNREGGLVPQTYPDIAKHPTIGFGHKLTPGDTWLYQQFPNGIDKLMGDTLFNQDLQNAEDAVYHAVGNVDGLSQNQFDSLVSFAFNVGRGNLANSTLAQKVKNRDLAGAANEFSNWVYAGGAKSQGLINRRAREETLFRHGIY